MSVDQSAYLIKLLSRFGEPFGLERSVKVCHRRLLQDRILLSIHKHALGASPSTALSKLLAELECPRQADDQLQQYLHEAEIVHIGYESDGSRLLYKCYLEFPGQFRSAQALPAKNDAVLVHIAGKWELGVADAITFSHYHGFTGLRCDAIVEKIRNDIYDSDTGIVLLDVLNELAGNSDKGSVDDVMLMLVTEPVNDRLSFDLNIYNWDYTILDIRPQLDRLMTSFDIPVELSASYLDRYAGDSAGHISAGYDRSGKQFFTLYHGVEEIVP